ncbi:hypothetical protein OAL35_00905 [bacterium]|nr:hypothetical protein [bacterium]
MSDQKNRIDEQAFDAMLAETLGGIHPPDLSDVVLQHLKAAEASPDATITIQQSPSSAAHTNRRRVRRRTAMAFLAALAASLVWFLVKPGSTPDPTVNETVAVNESSTVERPIEPPVKSSLDTDQDTKPKSSKPLRGIPLLVNSDDGPNTNDAIVDQRQVGPNHTLGDIQLVSKQVNEKFYTYWDAIGVTPTEEATNAETLARLNRSLGIQLPEELLGKPDEMRDHFETASNALSLAMTWLRLITNDGLRRLSEDERESLVIELGQCIEGKHSLDRTILGWIEGQNPRSNAFYKAVGAVGKTSTVKHLAKLTMNVDLRCVSCHDSKIEGESQQSEYWGFAAVLHQGVSRDANGGLSIDSKEGQQRTLFYELSDGRQQLAEPEVSARWLGGATNDSVKTIKSWADSLTGSQVLARGVVNSLWELVHGLPLHGRAVDPITAPLHESLTAIEDDLASDLIDSNFNVARTLALILTSPASGRSVPEALLPENALSADPVDRKASTEAVNAFAAAHFIRPQMPLARRIDQAMRSIGAKLDSLDVPIVAQATGVNGKGAYKPSSTKPESLDDDFPTSGEGLPVQWLTLISNPDDQTKHLAYLAGYDQVPETVLAAATAMKKANPDDRDLLLQRVWWLLRR